MSPPAAHRAAARLVQDFLEASARAHPDKVALVCRPRRVTYGWLDAEANALARALRSGGVGRGDRVVLFADNTVELVVALFAAYKAGAVPIVANPLTRAEKLAWYLRDSRATALVTELNHAAVVREAAPRSAHLKRVVVAGDGDVAGLGELGPLVVRWSDAVAEGRKTPGPPPCETLDVDLATIIYTSGSTGEPKGVMLTHQNMQAAALSISTLLGLHEGDVVLSALPLAFNYGLYQVLLTFRAGGCLVLERSFAYPQQVLHALQEERVTGFPGVPTMFALLGEQKNLGDFDLSSVRFVTNTAAALTERHVATLERAFPKARIFSMYGLTECKRCTYLPPEDLHRKPGSVGLAIPNTELWLVDEQDRRLGPNQVGQLVIRGATVMKGYWEKPKETAERLRPGPVPGELVLYTGDLCRLDDEGYLTFVGRMDDIIKSRGEKVAPVEVERALMSVPGVREVIVSGVPDPILGQAVKAWVALEPGSPHTEKSLQREVAKRLESFMVPKYVELRAELPKTAMGKLTRQGLS